MRSYGSNSDSSMMSQANGAIPAVRAVLVWSAPPEAATIPLRERHRVSEAAMSDCEMRTTRASCWSPGHAARLTVGSIEHPSVGAGRAR